jgi:hypothetical protein
MKAPAAGHTRLIIVGATGMVGGYALRYALDHPTVCSVTAIGRKKLGFSHLKLKEVLQSRLRGLLRTSGATLGAGRSGLRRVEPPSAPLFFDRLADAILTAVHDNGLPRDERGIVAC